MTATPIPYQTALQARRANPDWLTASEVIELVNARYGFSVHPTNVGVVARNHRRPTIDFYKVRKEQKLGHLYDPNDVDIYAWLLHLVSLQQRRELSPDALQKLSILDTRFAEDKLDLGYHMHHIVPKHAGGTNDASNLIRLTVYEHAIAHKALYQEFGRNADAWAWVKLISMCLKSKY